MRAALSIGDATERSFAELQVNADQIAAQTNETDLFGLLWPTILKHCRSLPTTIPGDGLFDACNMWLVGSSFPSILAELAPYRFGNRKPTIDHIVDLCENGFGFEASLIVGSCLTLLGLILPEEAVKAEPFVILQKRLRYGLPNALSATIYEMGLSDRDLAQRIAGLIQHEADGSGRAQVTKKLREHSDEIISHIRHNYRDYFSTVFAQITEARRM